MTNPQTKTIYCCGCTHDVEARLTDGKEIYPHRADLGSLPFWKCDACKNYVGCHHKTKSPTRPLGNIPTKQLRNARKQIHALMDPWWKGGRVQRSQIYHHLTDALGREYHTAELEDIEECRFVYKQLLEFGRKYGLRHN